MIRTPEVRAQADKLNDLLNKSISDTALPTYIQGHLGKYMCVLVSGFLETALAEVFCVYVNVRSQPAVASFSNATLRKIQNPKASKFIETVNKFNKGWAGDLEIFMTENAERRKGAIDSIMANRHLIAHGKNSNISLRQVKNYFDASIEVIEFIEGKIYL